jgi:very-short-patch-repair endonuclease
LLPESELENLSRPALLKEAQERRDTPTYAEKRLWKRLQGKRILGLSLRFQHVYHKYIFDFYCPYLKVVIEVDYSTEPSHIVYYEERDAKLEALGIMVLRYKNDKVMNHFNKVMDDIQNQLYELAIKKRKAIIGAQKQQSKTNPIPVPSPPLAPAKTGQGFRSASGEGARNAGGLGSEMRMSREIKDLIIDQARYMRQHPTRAEAFLWECIRLKKLNGYKFRRQHIIGTYIVDFYCPKRKLVVEVDGPIHQKQKVYDLSREINLIAMGYKILRFTNDEVIHHTDEVLKKIKDHLQS